MKSPVFGKLWPLVPFMCFGCGGGKLHSGITPTSAQAKATKPIVTEVKLVKIPSDPSLPICVVVVEPFTMAASGVTSGGAVVLNPGLQIGVGVAAQLVSSLRESPNFVVVDYMMYFHNPDKIVAGMRVGELGPFIIKGGVTEFSEVAESTGEGESKGPGLTPFIPYIGGIVSYGMGNKTTNESKDVGLVVLDVQIVDSSTGRLINSCTAEGNFTSVRATTSRTTWGNTKTRTDSAASAIGQAQRAAINQAALKIYETLVSKSAPITSRGTY